MNNNNKRNQLVRAYDATKHYARSDKPEPAGRLTGIGLKGASTRSAGRRWKQSAGCETYRMRPWSGCEGSLLRTVWVGCSRISLYLASANDDKYKLTFGFALSLPSLVGLHYGPHFVERRVGHRPNIEEYPVVVHRVFKPISVD